MHRKKLLVFFAALFFSQFSVAQTIQMRNRVLVNSLFATMNPDLPENSHWPEMVKSKIRWIMKENQAKPTRLLISPTDHWTNFRINTGNGMIPIASVYNPPGKIPDLKVSAEVVYFYAERLSKDQLRDTFFLSLMHEAIHLEKPGRPDAPYKEILEEEVRTWHSWILGAIRPMLSKGRSLLTDWVATERILKQCNDKSDCPAFVKVVREHLSPAVQMN